MIELLKVDLLLLIVDFIGFGLLLFFELVLLQKVVDHVHRRFGLLLLGWCVNRDWYLHLVVFNLLWRWVDRHGLMLEIELFGIVEFHHFRAWVLLELLLLGRLILVRSVFLLPLILPKTILWFFLLLLMLILLEVVKPGHIDHLDLKPALFGERLLLLDQLLILLFFLLPLLSFLLQLFSIFSDGSLPLTLLIDSLKRLLFLQISVLLLVHLRLLLSIIGIQCLFGPVLHLFLIQLIPVLLLDSALFHLSFPCGLLLSFNLRNLLLFFKFFIDLLLILHRDLELLEFVSISNLGRGCSLDVRMEPGLRVIDVDAFLVDLRLILLQGLNLLIYLGVDLFLFTILLSHIVRVIRLFGLDLLLPLDLLYLFLELKLFILKHSFAGEGFGTSGPSLLTIFDLLLPLGNLLFKPSFLSCFGIIVSSSQIFNFLLSPLFESLNLI